MINVSQQVVVYHNVERVVRVNVKGSVVEVREPVQPNVQIITVGTQGAVGTVAENVLQRALQAELAATEAAALAGDTLQGLTTLVDGMKSSLDYHTGAISALAE